jgi:diacylglycerol kinase
MTRFNSGYLSNFQISWRGLPCAVDFEMSFHNALPLAFIFDKCPLWFTKSNQA